jgi:hypothetical protein
MNDPGKKKRRGETLKKKSICRLPCRASRRAEGGAGRGDARLWRTPSEVVCAWGAQEAIWSDLSWGLRGMQVVPCMHALRAAPSPRDLDSSALVFIWRSNVPSCPNASKPYLLQNYRYTWTPPVPAGCSPLSLLCCVNPYHVHAYVLGSYIWLQVS